MLRAILLAAYIMKKSIHILIQLSLSVHFHYIPTAVNFCIPFSFGRCVVTNDINFIKLNGISYLYIVIESKQVLYHFGIITY